MEGAPLGSDAHRVSGHSMLDSCLLNIIQVLPQLDQYTVVDVRAGAVSKQFPVTNTLAIPSPFLTTKAYLKNTPLLLVGDSFSRAQVSSLCVKLKSNGFQQVYALSGGVDTLLSLPQGHFSSVSVQKTSELNARQLVSELQLGRVVLVVKSADERALRELGIKNYHLTETSFTLPVSAIEASNGYHPIVLLGLSGKAQNSVALNNYQNIYFLPGGVEDLYRYRQDIQLINENRLGVPNRFRCAGD